MSDIPVHLLPFSVDQEGPINTKQYLKIEKENEHYETVIMGRKLIGNHIILPDTTIGKTKKKKKNACMHAFLLYLTRIYTCRTCL